MQAWCIGFERVIRRWRFTAVEGAGMKAEAEDPAASPARVIDRSIIAPATGQAARPFDPSDT
ncbi:MAG: hypothetical protein R3E68_23495 [Burkholderiaceae bacterium]